MEISEDKWTIQCFEETFSAAQTLPPELLSDIFSRCVSQKEWDNDIDPRRSMRCSSQTPLLLGRVCSRWRDVSNSSPDLWASFFVGDEYFSLADFGKDLKAIRHWIAKSDSRPLSILIHYPRSYSYGALLVQILESIVSQSWRWKEIKLLIPSGFKHIILAPFRTGNLPQLVKFDSTTVGGGSAVFILSSAPLLQDLHHRGKGHVDFSGGTHDIKRIEINHSEDPDVKISLADFFTCFTHCPLLERLTIPISIGAGLPDELPSTIDLCHLTHLNLSIFLGIDPGLLLECTFLPVLISLELYMEDADIEYTGWPHIETMLVRSRPPLQVLRLLFVPITEVTLIGCLSLIPTLRSLEFEGVQCSDLILDALTLDEADHNASRHLCPWLESVDFGNNWRFSELAMRGMILSRVRNAKNTGFTRGKALTSIKCPFDFTHIRSNPDISECLKEGLVLIGCD